MIVDLLVSTSDKYSNPSIFQVNIPHILPVQNQSYLPSLSHFVTHTCYQGDGFNIQSSKADKAVPPILLWNNWHMLPIA